MGQQLSSEKFDAICEPILKKKHTPPEWFAPQKITQRCLPLQAVVELAFLADGTVAGNAVMYNSPNSIAIRGTFHVDVDTRHVQTNLELSCDEATAENGIDADMGNNLIVMADGRLAPRGGKASRSGAGAGAADNDAMESFEMEMLGEHAFAEQHLPPIPHQAELDEAARKKNKSSRDDVRRNSRSESETALAAALSALGVTDPQDSDAFFIREDEFNKGEEGQSKKRGHGEQGDDDLAHLSSAARNRRRSSPGRHRGATSAPTVHAGSPGGKERSESPFSRSRSRSIGAVHQKQQKPKRLFERIGSYSIPLEEEELKELFADWAGDGCDFIPRDVFVADLMEFEAEQGLELSPFDLERAFDKVDVCAGAGSTRDNKLSFREFELFMLQRAKS